MSAVTAHHFATRIDDRVGFRKSKDELNASRPIGWLHTRPYLYLGATSSVNKATSPSDSSTVIPRQAATALMVSLAASRASSALPSLTTAGTSTAGASPSTSMPASPRSNGHDSKDDVKVVKPGDVDDDAAVDTDADPEASVRGLVNEVKEEADATGGREVSVADAIWSGKGSKGRINSVGGTLCG